mmetsp:Transcript_62070/g.148050  ORF Transcript_62070/g.148050 Transcript_62070/m.148050 type:complete len:244 (-) Transcript_62070:1623-2354(-)
MSNDPSAPADSKACQTPSSSDCRGSAAFAVSAGSSPERTCPRAASSEPSSLAVSKACWQFCQMPLNSLPIATSGGAAGSVVLRSCTSAASKLPSALASRSACLHSSQDGAPASAAASASCPERTWSRAASKLPSWLAASSACAQSSQTVLSSCGKSLASVVRPSLIWPDLTSASAASSAPSWLAACRAFRKSSNSSWPTPSEGNSLLCSWTSCAGSLASSAGVTSTWTDGLGCCSSRTVASSS